VLPHSEGEQSNRRNSNCSLGYSVHRKSHRGAPEREWQAEDDRESKNNHERIVGDRCSGSTVALSRVAYVSGVPNDRDVFAYASSAPTALAVVGTVVRDGVSVSELRYDDGAHGTVSALIAEPAVGARPVASAVILAHGGFEAGKQILLKEAVELARHGLVALAADTTFPRTGHAASVRSAIRRGVVIHRRGLDVLESAYGASTCGARTAEQTDAHAWATVKAPRRT